MNLQLHTRILINTILNLNVIQVGFVKVSVIQ